jgi:DNA polymerase III subunit delta'
MSIRFIGNEMTRSRLNTLVEIERLHACMLFEGPRGVGKATTALWLASLVNCEADDSSARPCGGCWSCRQIPKGQHPDIIQIGLDPTKTAPIISVGQARSVISQLMVKPFHARHRFVIIDPADAMTPAAANALLKTFEDPPSQTHFVLVTSAPASLLLTVRSRSQRVRFAPAQQAEIQAWLEEQNIDQPAEVARLAEGCPGRALTMDLAGVDDWRTSRDALIAAVDGDVAARFKFAEHLCKGDRAKWSRKVEQSLDAMSSVLRDALAVSQNGTIVYNDDRPDLVSDWARRLGPGGVAYMADVVADAHERLARFVNGRLVVDAVLTQLGHALEQGGRHASI